MFNSTLCRWVGVSEGACDQIGSIVREVITEPVLLFVSFTRLRDGRNGQRRVLLRDGRL